ncbi:hypothetical protein HQ560_02235 [bacterium]|nr:hypothetical protein [bacterium]
MGRSFGAFTLLAAVACAGAADRWSPPVDGLRVRFVSDRDVYEEGQRVWLYLDVRNVSDKPVNLAYGHSLRNRLRLTDSEGRTVPFSNEPDSVSVRTVPPGKQVDLMLFYVCGKSHAMFTLLEPGSYRASWEAKKGETIRGRNWQDGLPTSDGPVEEGRLAPPCEATFRVVPKKPAGKPVPAPWGKAVGGLRTRLRADRNVFASGRPIPITVEVENTGDAKLHYHTQSVAFNNGLRVLDGSGRSVPFIGGWGQTGSSMHPLAPGQKADLGDADVAAYYYVGKPGRYTVQWPGAKAWGKIDSPPFQRPADSDIPASNTFSFEIVPPEHPDPFGEALGVLLEKRPKEWWVESSPPLSGTGRVGGRWSRVHHRRYYFEHTDRRLGGMQNRLQVHNVGLAIAGERAVVDPWHLGGEEAKRPWEYLGRGTYGHVYLRRLDKSILERWPSVQADLIEWLGVETVPSRQ